LSLVVTKAPAFPPAPGSAPDSLGIPTPEPPPDAITVLVVDDERSNLESIE
jgi:hypothetical protein